MSSNAVQVNNARRCFGSTHALDGAGFHIACGERIALLGPNGAGKTTLIRAIGGLANLDEGTITLFGQPATEEARYRLGVVPQDLAVQGALTAEENLHLFGRLNRVTGNTLKDRVEETLQWTGLEDRRHDLVKEFSGGMKRRLMIARALIHRPRLLILDEPTAGVDIELRRSMWSCLTELNREGITIILTTHYLEEAEQLCRNIGIIDRGNIVRNTSMRELLKQLHVETFLLDLKESQLVPPELGNYPARLVDHHTLEVQVDKSQGVTDLFRMLSAQGIEVLSLRNKTNRLEELFVSMVENNLPQGAK